MDSTSPPKNRVLGRIGFDLLSLIVVVAVIRWSESLLLGILALVTVPWLAEWLFPRPQSGVKFKLPGSKKQHLGVAIAACLMSLGFVFTCVEYPELSTEMTDWMKLVVIVGGLAFAAYALHWHLIRLWNSNKET